MQFERMRLTGEAGELAARLRDLVPPPAAVQNEVAEIIAQVRMRGDEAIQEYTRRFDGGSQTPRRLRVEPAELEAARVALDPAVRRGLELAIENVHSVAARSRRADQVRVEFAEHQVLLRSTPLMRAGVYVPGGRAPYPSTVVMGVVSARAAGVADVAVCAPPGPDGDVDSVILAACALAGATDVYRVGGAQAIAAMAYGSESVAAVEVIVGPGNLYVQEAKRQVFGHVGIDNFAGPSDLLMLADADSDPEPLALDLLAQAEHGPGSLVIAVSTSSQLLDQLGDRLASAADTGAVARLIDVEDDQSALALAEAFAPEHLQLVGTRAEELAPAITRAGCLFVGAAAGTAFGDYVAGSNHILPTNGAARFASGLSPVHFQRAFAEVRIADPSQLARAAAPVARAEGFEFHARSMEARIRDNERR